MAGIVDVKEAKGLDEGATSRVEVPFTKGTVERFRDWLVCRVSTLKRECAYV